MIVVTDTSPLNYLVIVRAESILPAIYDRVVAPPATIREMLHSAAPVAVRLWASSPPEWLEVVVPGIIDETIQLGEGETEAISLAEEIQADALLMDDRQAIAAAVRRGHRITGTLGVLELAAQLELIELHEILARLAQTNFRCASSVIEDLRHRHERRMRGD